MSARQATADDIADDAADPPALATAPAPPAGLRDALLRWFDTVRRPLPWRAAADSYGVWVSEIMLQQTQVDRVIGYWQRFMVRFPSVRALAGAPLDDVLAAWSGLGYYSRARNLHRAAQALEERFGGSLPSDPALLRTLPGFGPYTAGAVASIAFGLEAPLVDGNVARVLSRALAIEGAPGDRAREAHLWAAAAGWVKGDRPGDFNQALMELGALVCTPTTPSCGACPVRAWCRAHATGRTAELPPPKAPPRRKRIELAVAVCARDGQVLLARRREAGLFGGLWELPAAPKGRSARAALARLLGDDATVGESLGTVERTLTHRLLALHLRLVALPAELGRPPGEYAAWDWTTLSRLAERGLSSATRAALRQGFERAGHSVGFL